VAQRTGVPDGAADIVTCAQSLHHTEPAGTLAEIGRILRFGGVFAAYDYDWPPMVHWEANHVFATFMDGVRALRKKHGIESEQEQWGKDEHVERMRRSGLFRHVSEISLHNVERCTAERWSGSRKRSHRPARARPRAAGRRAGVDGAPGSRRAHARGQGAPVVRELSRPRGVK